MSLSFAALLISALSLVLAGASFGWQVAQWLLSGGRPKATLMSGMADPVRAWVAPVGKDGAGADLSSLNSQGFDGTPVVGIQVTNHGRAPVVVEKVAVIVRGGGGLSLVPVADLIGPGLPHRLEQGANASWYVPADGAAALVSTARTTFNANTSGIYMTAQLATGKVVATRRTLRL